MLDDKAVMEELHCLTLPKSTRGHSKRPRGPHALNYRIQRGESFGNPQDPIPERLLLIRPFPGDPARDQLFLDHLPLPRDAWRFDETDRIISWRGAYGGGHLYLSHQDLGATGNIGAAHAPVSVTASSTANFLCDVALDTGATYLTSDKSATGLSWNPTSEKWMKAAWVPNRLLLSYTVTPGGPMEPPTIAFAFTDEQTEAPTWYPSPLSSPASLALGQQSGLMVWNLTFVSNDDPDEDAGINPPIGPKTVYPDRLRAVEDAAAATINGALQTSVDNEDNEDKETVLVGMRGERVQATASGFFRTSADAAPFGVFDGRLMIDGRPAGRSNMRGAELQWRDLTPQQQHRTGLPESGTLRFTADGSSATSHSLAATRLDVRAIAEALARHSDLHPTLHQRATQMTAAAGDTSLSMYGLLAMAPFVQDPQTGAWGDAVQAAVTSDLSAIMNSFIPPAMWKLIFQKDPQPTLSGELAKVAATPVPGYPNPGTWYATLATAVVTQGLGNGNAKACAFLNGPRAGEWLKTEVAASRVYNEHSQLLFQYQWQQRFPLTRSYLTDQEQKAKTYDPQIDAQIAAQIKDIKTNVAVDSNSPPNLIQKLIDQVQEAGNYAKAKRLYWAFSFYIYNTAPAILSNIALQIGISTGSNDGTTLTRLVQQNMEVLTALDPSGFFVRQYTATLNTFLATNILPSMFGFTGDAMSFDVIKEYIQQFIANNLTNENEQIAQAARQMQETLAAGNADEMLKSSIDALRVMATTNIDALAMPIISKQFVKWFEANYKTTHDVASFFGSMFIGGVTALAIFNVIGAFKQWDKLTPGQKAGTIIEATELGLQVFAGVVTRGVRVAAMFSVDGMTRMQRTGAIGKILFTGKAEKLDLGLVKIGNATARWLGDTEGTVGKGVMYESRVLAMIDNAGVEGAESASWAAKVFGKNLDEFVATRVGPVLIVAGIGLSIFFISTGESGVALASDILNIVSGSLMLFAMIGDWAIAGATEGIMAGLIGAAGVLSVIAALAGLGLMLYQMFHKPPDPVQEFVTQYAKPAGFAVESKASAIDYAIVYENPDRDRLLMIGFTLMGGGATLACGSDGAVSLISQPTALPNCVWIAETDGVGQSRIMTIAQRAGDLQPVALWLSLMSDNTVSFQPKRQVPSPDTLVPAAGVTVVTQTWLSAPQWNANVTTKGQLSSVGLTFRPVRADELGNYVPGKASGWLVAGSGKVSYSASGPGTTFVLVMSPMAPNYMTMMDLDFLLDTTPDTAESFGPRFGIPPSMPVTYSYGGSAPLPAFLSFKATSGTFSPNGKTASAPEKSLHSISAKNAAGHAEAPFVISVAPAPVPPKIAAPALPLPSPAPAQKSHDDLPAV